MIKKHTTHKEKKKEKSDEMFHAKAFPNFEQRRTNFWNSQKRGKEFFWVGVFRQRRERFSATLSSSTLS